MRAGHSFAGALQQAADGATEPRAPRLQRAVTDERLGVPIDVALAAVGRRMRNDELEYVGLVANLQRETGGNTAEVLDRVIETTRARQQLRRLVRTLTAQGRLGGAIVSALPVAWAWSSPSSAGLPRPAVPAPRAARLMIVLASLHGRPRLAGDPQDRRHQGLNAPQP